jgi:hypothetical protein
MSSIKQLVFACLFTMTFIILAQTSTNWRIYDLNKDNTFSFLDFEIAYEKPMLLPDLNADGSRDSLDSFLLLRYLSSLDSNADGQVNDADNPKDLGFNNFPIST